MKRGMLMLKNKVINLSVNTKYFWNAYTLTSQGLPTQCPLTNYKSMALGYRLLAL